MKYFMVLVGLAAWGAPAQEPVMGRYVRVEIPREKATLSLAEVQVFAKGENVALKGTASQVSTIAFKEGSAARFAIDGNTDGAFYNGSVTHTCADIANPWWEVDLGAEWPIEKIVVWNRTDAAQDRLIDARVVILDDVRKEAWRRVLVAPGKRTELAVAAPASRVQTVQPSAAALPDELKRLHDIYEKNLTGLVTGQRAQARGFADKYLATLKLLQERAQKAGNLDGVLAATEELERMAKGETVTEGANGAKFADLNVARTAYMAALRVSNGDTARRTADLTRKYGHALAGLQADFTREGQIADAMAVKAECASLDARPEVVWADGAQTNAVSAALTAVSSVAVSTALPDATDGLYLVIDLSGGKDAEKYPVSYLPDVPKGGWTDEHKTARLVLRKIKAGTFVMGSPGDEVGRRAAAQYFPWTAETQHTVTLTRDFYIGVFEVTQRQWELVMGDRPSLFRNEGCWARRPVEKGANFKVIRGRGFDFDEPWPESHRAGDGSFLQRLRVRTGLRTLDLPTEAQWEYACRAGTRTALNSKKNLKNPDRDSAMDAVGRYKYNSGADDKSCAEDSDILKGTTVVGSYAPNAWGLYDMHGNVCEWCLDRPEPYAGDAKDPQGAVAKPIGTPGGGDFIRRGGGYRSEADGCRSASRYWNFFENAYGEVGFRLAMTVR